MLSYDTLFPNGELEKADGQLGDHVAVGGEYEKIFGLGDPGELNGGVIFRTNTQQPFQPLDTKEQNDESYQKMYGPHADGIKEFNEFYRRKK